MTIYMQCRCTKCGHKQETEIINPVTEGDTLITGYLGSRGHYCDKCDGSVEHVGARREHA